MDSLKNLDPAKSTTDLETKFDHETGTSNNFVVTTIVNGENSAEPKQELRAVLVEKKSPVPMRKEVITSEATTSSKAIIPLPTSLPSKLLRHHAKKSAQNFLRTLNETNNSPNDSIDSQLGDSDESGAVGGTDEADDFENDSNECADIYDIPTPTAPSMSPQPPGQDDEKLIDVGMGSSIECSEESEEDDELKPLAVDNHLFDVDLNSHPTQINSPQQARSSPPTAVLSEANLKKHYSHHNYQNLDNIYLHPNFHYDLEGKDILESSPPPAVAPSNSPTEPTEPTEPKRVHRSFLTLKKSNNSETENEKANSVQSHATTASTAEQNIINEIDTLDPALVPSDELATEITDAVEFYFSNESILKDAFLLKHVRRNKEGFVSLKLVSSFKRVRQLTKEWKVVGNAVRRKSHKIELNDIGTKVRRIEPLPNFDETMPSRTIVACDLPLEKLSIEKVSDIFSKCGEIALIRILKPGMTIPVDVRQFMNKYPEMQQKECALVEYLESSSAREAKNLQGNFKVYDMVAPKKKTGKKAVIQVAAPIARMVENYRFLNDLSYERARGGSFSGVIPQETDIRYKLKRNNSDFHGKPLTEMALNQSHYHQHQNHYNAIHRGSFGNEQSQPYHYYQPRNSISHDINAIQLSPNQNNNNNIYNFQPRRYSSNSTVTTHNIASNPNQESGSNNILNNTNNNINTNLLNQNCGGSASLLNNTNLNNNNNNNINNNNSNNNLFTRRTSNGSESFNSTLEVSRRLANCSEQQPPQRRDSQCNENCPCNRRVSDFGQNEVYRKTSQGSIGSVGERRYSNGSMQFERTFSNASDIGNCAPTYHRRMSNDFNFERKPSIDAQTTLHYENDGNVGGGGGGYQVFPRRYSNNFNISSKLAAYDNAQYINGRRVSTDSGYDRRFSFGSEYEGSPRSRTGSFLSNYDGQPRSRTGSFLDGSPRSRSGSFAQRAADSLIRTPIGPDGSKGFGTRARKFGQTVSPVN